MKSLDRTQQVTVGCCMWELHFPSFQLKILLLGKTSHNLINSKFNIESLKYTGGFRREQQNQNKDISSRGHECCLARTEYTKYRRTASLSSCRVEGRGTWPHGSAGCNLHRSELAHPAAGWYQMDDGFFPKHSSYFLDADGVISGIMKIFTNLFPWPSWHSNSDE